MSVILSVADAITSQLNARSWDMAFTATREYMPQFELRDTKTLRVTVVPRETKMVAHDRASSRFHHTVDVAVMRRYQSGQPAEVDPLLTLCDAIVDELRQKRLTLYPAAWCIGVDHPILYSSEHWEQFRQFTSIMAFTYMVVK